MTKQPAPRDPSEAREQFRALLLSEDRDGCVRFAVEGLAESRFSIPELYEAILGPCLAESEVCDIGDMACIWHEHVRSGIIRTVIENCWPAVSRAAAATEPKNAAVLVFCPEKEYHELGARMVADFFTLSGWKTAFAGANTPREQIRAAIVRERPAIVAVSVSDFYNLVEAQKAIARIRNLLVEKGLTDVQILAGGGAFHGNPDGWRAIGADGLLHTFDDIRRLTAVNGTREAAGTQSHSPVAPAEGSAP